MGDCIVLGEFEEVKLQKFGICLFGLVYVGQYVRF